MANSKKRFTCIDLRGLWTANIRILFVDCISLYMDSNKHHKPGLKDLQPICNPSDLILLRQILVYLCGIVKEISGRFGKSYLIEIELIEIDLFKLDLFEIDPFTSSSFGKTHLMSVSNRSVWKKVTW